METKKELYVHLFGRFEILFGGKLLTIAKGKNSNPMRLLQILMANYDTGISREELLQDLFGNREISDVSNSLRVAFHRLRKEIAASGVPAVEYFPCRDGIFRCSGEIPFQSDLEEFLEYMEKAKQEKDSEKKIELLMQVSRVHRGEFLEDSATEEWVIIRSVQYKRMYNEAMRELMDLLRERRDYKKMLDVSILAGKIYPYDEWQVYQIESLVKMGRDQEGYEVYTETLQRYNDELEIQMPEEMAERIRKITQKTGATQEQVGEISSKLEEPIQEVGAIYLNAYSFVDTFRFMVRLAERNHQMMCLMVCTLKENVDTPMRDPNIIEESAEALTVAIRESLRKGDCYTRYSGTQFLTLLVGTEEEKCELVFRRIDSKFRKYRKTWHGTLGYYIEPIAQLRKGEGKVQLQNNKLLIDDNI